MRAAITVLVTLALFLAVGGCRPTPPPQATATTSPSPTAPAPASTPAADLNALAQAAEAAPKDAKAQARYGSALVEAGEAAKGIGYLRRAVALDPTLTAAWHNLGLAAERQGWLDVAAEAFGRVVAAKPDHAGEWVKRGYALIALGRYGEAEGAFRRASALRPESSDTLVALASSYYADFRFDEALDALKRAAALNPRSAAAHVNAAAIHVERREFAEAETEIRAALRIEPENPRYHMILGRILAASPDAANRAAGAQALERALALHRQGANGGLDAAAEAEANHWLGVIAREADRGNGNGGARAVSLWQRALTLDPARPDTLRALGQALVRQGGGAAAEGRRMLGEYERLQRLRDADREIRQRVEQHLDDGAARLRFGRVLMEQGNLARAVWELREAVRLRPGDADARSALADALRRQGRDGEAGAAR